MAYVNADGTVAGQRSMFRLSIISDIFWAVADVIGTYNVTLFLISLLTIV